MADSRRDFLKRSSAALLGASAFSSKPAAGASDPPTANEAPGALPADAPPAFGTAPPVGPPVTPATFAAAEKLVQVELSETERAQAAANWRSGMAALYELRTGPRKVALDASAVPYSLGYPMRIGHGLAAQDHFRGSDRDPGPVPGSGADIAYAPVWKLSKWIERRELGAERLTKIYLERLERFDPKLRCVITLARESALRAAQAADREIARGRYRGPLHGIPWGAKDLLDTAGIRTTYGAEPYEKRVPSEDAAVVRRLKEAGAVLIAKLSLGALALNDVWFGGQTMNPWLLEEGSSGSSAGPGAAVAAGLVAFAIGSETEGSIVSPSMRCGVTGLRPTFGRVPRTGSMTLCWSLDKLGPMARSVEDTMLVLRTIGGPDAGDVASVPSRLDFDARGDIKGLRVGYFPDWMDSAPANELDRRTLSEIASLGMQPVKVTIPDWPYDSLNTILFAESAAAFEELTLSHQVDRLKMQTVDAWPNTFRQSRFLSAVDFVQADRFRGKVADEMTKLLSQVDLLLVPSLQDEMLTIGNFIGLPSLTLPAGFVEVKQARSDWAPDPGHPLPTFDPPRRVPHGVTLIGRHFDEGTIGRVGLALERALNVSDARPPGF
ncbi:MAG TPA: amidase family protein [Steroidobacteraceae bacterium]|nr:amidase family protein [Steroidobacteraceae bacterium]